MKNSPTTINAGPVLCAGKAATIEQAQTGGQPSVRGTLTGWFKPMIIGVVSEDIQQGGDRDGQVSPVVREVKTSGVVLADDEDLDTRPEGQRSWAHGVLYVYPQLEVATDTRIIINGKPYRVIKKKDFGTNGYIRYNVREDFERA